MHTVAEWVTSIPDAVTPREGIALIDVALGDARDATAALVSEYKGGTLPPPPWPQPPELVTAIEALEGGKLLLGQAINLGYADTKFPKSDPHTVRLVNGGRALYAAIDKMQREHREGTIKPENLPKLAERAARKLLPTGLGGLAALIALAYIVDHWGSE